MSDYQQALGVELGALAERSARARRRNQLILWSLLALVSAGFAIAVVVYVFDRHVPRPFRTSELVTLVVSLAVLVGSAWRLRVTLAAEPLLKSLQGSRVVWAYKTRTGMQTELVLATADGWRHRIAYVANKPRDRYTPAELALEERLFAEVVARFPGAVLGYSRTTATAFDRDPTALDASGGDLSVEQLPARPS